MPLPVGIISDEGGMVGGLCGVDGIVPVSVIIEGVVPVLSGGVPAVPVEVVPVLSDGMPVVSDGVVPVMSVGVLAVPDVGVLSVMGPVVPGEVAPVGALVPSAVLGRDVGGCVGVPAGGGGCGGADGRGADCPGLG